ncbi:acyl carrier protein [Streptomyces sp. NPDC050625]|jgi:acyl carrier protein|uniref:acyl carrier protein n=1 Tax=Streptomyces sp. NPDC050625 TaxID=3154629 RepID=UPI0034427BAE
MNPIQPTTEPADEEAVLADIRGMLLILLEEYGEDDVEIGMSTTFNRDLELESIDLVTLAGLLEQRYGDRVNFAEFLAGMDFDEIIELTVGRLVEHVVQSLKAAEAG